MVVVTNASIDLKCNPNLKDVRKHNTASLESDNVDAVVVHEILQRCLPDRFVNNDTPPPTSYLSKLVVMQRNEAALIRLQGKVHAAFQKQLLDLRCNMAALEREEQECQAKLRNHALETQRQRIPLVSQMNEDLWTRLSEFLTDQEFLKLEDAVMNFVPADCLSYRWARQKPNDYFRQQFPSGLQQRLGRRVVRFREASAFAQRMEESARQHYNAVANTVQSYEWPDRLYRRQDFCRDYQDYYKRNPVQGGKSSPSNNRAIQGPIPDVEFFVRMTYQEDDGSKTILLEGFRPPVIALDQNPKENYTTMGFSRDNAWMSMRFADVQSYYPKIVGLIEAQGRTTHGASPQCQENVWSDESKSLFLDRVSITILACSMKDNSIPLSPQLIVSTHGYDADSYEGSVPYKSHIGFLKDRPTNANIRYFNDYNLDDFVSVGIYSHHHSRDTVGIYLKWGCYFI